jgi:hypothetical protein
MGWGGAGEGLWWWLGVGVGVERDHYCPGGLAAWTDGTCVSLPIPRPVPRQILAIFASSKVDWPPSIKTFLQYLSVFNFNIEYGVGVVGP